MGLHAAVPENYFSPLRLSDAKLRELRAEADKAVAQALVQCSTLQSVHYTIQEPSATPMGCVQIKHDVHKESTAPHKTRPSLSVSQVFGHVQGDYVDLLRGLKAETREAYFNIHKKLFSFTSDAFVLHNIQPRSAFVDETITWAAFELFPLQRRADSCQYEANGVGVDAQGKSYAFHVVIPAAFPEVPDTFKVDKTVRILSTSVVIARPQEAICHHSDVYAVMQNDFRSSHAQRSMHRRIRLMLQDIHALTSSQHTATPWVFTREAGWVPETQPTACSHCVKLFTVFRAKHSCVVCSRAVCRRCLVKASEVVDTQTSKRRSRENNAKVCTPCVKLLREDQEHAMVAAPVVLTDEQTTPHHLRLSETPRKPPPTAAISLTDRVAGRTVYQLRTSTQSTVSSADWVTTPPYQARVRASRSTDIDTIEPTSFSSDESDEFEWERYQRVFHEEEEPVEDEEDVVMEEAHASTPGVLFTVDTSEMTRVKPSVESAETANDSGLLFHHISASLQEQTSLLNQMRMHAADWRARTEATSL